LHNKNSRFGKLLSNMICTTNL